MTEEPIKNASASPEKLLIDDPSDFQFHAAYLTYSNLYDKTSNLESRKQLNQNITALQQKQIDYQTFYRNINQFRGEEEQQFNYSRAFITTQRKRDWRKKEQKQERIRRHKK